MLRTYDPKAVSVIFGGVQITGFEPGTMIEVEPDEDEFSLQVGTDGEGARAKNNNESATITINLQQVSPSNAVMEAFRAADKLAVNGNPVPFMVRDRSGLTVCTAQHCWIQKQPTTSFGNEFEPRVWTLRTESLKDFNGGNNRP